MSEKTRILAVIALALITILAACTPEPEVVVETVIQEVEVTRVVTETIVEEGESIEVTRVIVETETVEVEVTAVPEEAAPVANPPNEPQQGGDLRIWQPNGWPEQSWPHRSNWESGWAIGPMAETLFWALPGSLEPRLATGSDVSDDGLVYMLYLREGVLWHDGEPFTAEDVVFSIHLRNSPDLRPLNGLRQGRTISGMIDYNDGNADSIAGIEIVDDFTIQFTLDSPDAGLARLFFAGEMVEILPEHIVSALDEEEVLNGTAEYWFTNPIGTGPYKFVQYQVDQFIEYERFDDYWGGAPTGTQPPLP